jgi:tetratricopeptide (TPR) repeat protein
MWPFKKKVPKPQPNSKETTRRLIEKTEWGLRVDSMDYFGEYAESPNAQFTLSWSDATLDGSVGGHRNSGEGRYLLARDQEIIFVGRMQRPNNGQVSDRGLCVLNDWMFGDDLSGTAYAFDVSGREILQHRFDANLYNCGVSNDGQLGIFQTANNDNADGNLLSLFDLTNGALLWSVHPESGWGDSYVFDQTNQTVSLVVREIGEFRYSLSSGQFLDSESLREGKLSSGSGFEVQTIAEQARESLTSESTKNEIDEAIALFNTSLDRGLSEYPWQAARAWRSIGEIEELRGDLSEAVLAYEKAIDLDPKVGVKRRLGILKAKLE